MNLYFLRQWLLSGPGGIFEKANLQQRSDLIQGPAGIGGQLTPFSRLIEGARRVNVSDENCGRGQAMCAVFPFRNELGEEGKARESKNFGFRGSTAERRTRMKWEESEETLFFSIRLLLLSTDWLGIYVIGFYFFLSLYGYFFCKTKSKACVTEKG